MQTPTLSPAAGCLLSDAISGLNQFPKTLPCKYFYDRQGSLLFDRICELDEYYPTRIETQIMCRNISEIADLIPAGAMIVEYGSGSSTKTKILLDHLPVLAAYVPVDISRDHLAITSGGLELLYSDIEIAPVCADYTQPFNLPRTAKRPTEIVAYFPGSTIGNFHPGEAVDFLRRIASLCGRGGALLIGVDLDKDRSILEPAYNDSLGVTAAFNRNLLERLNREAGADFDVDQFEHCAFYDAAMGRIEMHLVCRRRQTVRVAGVPIQFDAGESILTECSYKYSLSAFATLARHSGFRVEKVWTDPGNLFSIQYLRSL